MMVRTSTAGLVGGALSNLLKAQLRQEQAALQVGSEKRAVDHKGYGRDAEQLTAVRTVHARAEAFAAAGSAAADRLSAQNLHLESISDAAQGARQAIATALANSRADGMMGELGSRFSSAVTGLNGKHQGRYLFAGTTVDQKPVTVSTMAELAAAPATANVFANDTRRAAVQIDESTTLQTGFLADETATPLFESLRRIQQFADGPGGPLTGRLTAAQTAFLEGELAALDAAHEGLIGVVAQNGGLQNQAESAVKSQLDQAAHFEGLLVDKTGVNMAEAITRLQMSQTAVQASAQVLATLKQSSLLELLR